jgi:D-serine dehydratase
MLESLTELSARKIFDAPPIVSAGGSAFFQIVAGRIAATEIEANPVLRSGCYIVNDHGLYARAQVAPALQGAVNLRTPLRPALEVWSHVQSRPEPGLAVVALGKRDISHDIELPLPVYWVRRGERAVQTFDGEVRVLGLNDQHAMIALPASHPLAVGDLVALGCSHPCTTFDKWKTILVVDDAYDVVDAIATVF